jgi:tRNA1Val (adenine37-N6)-methyltransferase
MKVGTDGVLLGAWGSVEGKRILDIGTGTGLIALMAAQRNPEADVLGIDIDESAVAQAIENVAESPFSRRIECVLQDVLTFESEAPFDAILCNPPFFTEDTLPEDAARSLARNSKNLPFSKLVTKASALLAEGGLFSIIIPARLMTEVIGLCMNEGMYLERRCLVRTLPHKPPRRVMLTFSRNPNASCEEQQLCIMATDGPRSQDYAELTKDFFL